MSVSSDKRSSYGTQPFGMTVFGAGRQDQSVLLDVETIEFTVYIKMQHLEIKYLTLTKSQDVEL